jgi:hypothetical protein
MQPRAARIHRSLTGREGLVDAAFPGFHPGLFSSPPYGRQSKCRNNCNCRSFDSPPPGSAAKSKDRSLGTPELKSAPGAPFAEDDRFFGGAKDVEERYVAAKDGGEIGDSMSEEIDTDADEGGGGPAAAVDVFFQEDLGGD